MRTVEQFKEDIAKLSAWIDELRVLAEQDADIPWSVFKSSMGEEPFSIVGGWSYGFSEDYKDVLYISKSNPHYAMCIKIVVSDWNYTSYETLRMPLDRTNEVEDLNIALERGDLSEDVAMFYLIELERILKEY